MAELARHTAANREFFAKRRAPHVSEWVDWIERGVVEGKIIDGKPWVDLNAFAARRVLSSPAAAANDTVHDAGLQLLARAGLR